MTKSLKQIDKEMMLHMLRGYRTTGIKTESALPRKRKKRLGGDSKRKYGKMFGEAK